MINAVIFQRPEKRVALQRILWNLFESRKRQLQFGRGIPDFTGHHMRHTFCSRLCEGETNIKVIQAIMGHKDIQTTLDIYTEVSEKKKRASLMKLYDDLKLF